MKKLAGRLRRTDSKLIVEPDLGPREVCGGLRSPYWPNLTEEELDAILHDAEASESEIAMTHAELHGRALRSWGARVH